MANKFKKQTPAQRKANERRAKVKSAATGKPIGAIGTSNYAGLNQPTEPLTIRLPKTGYTDPFWNLNRSTWRALIIGTPTSKPQIRAKQFKLHGEKRGIWLIDFADAKRVLSPSEVSSPVRESDPFFLLRHEWQSKIKFAATLPGRAARIRNEIPAMNLSNLAAATTIAVDFRSQFGNGCEFLIATTRKGRT